MADLEKEEKQEEKKPKKIPSPAIGSQAQPTVLDNTIKSDIDIYKTLVDSIIDASLSSKLDIGELEKFTSIANNRDQIYQLIDIMCQDSSVSSIVRTYAEDVCDVADNGHIMWAESADPAISKYVNYLLNNMNVDKYVYGWAYCLIKYGDVYLKLFRESDYKDVLFNKDKIEKARQAKNVLNESLRDEINKLDENVNLSIHRGTDTYSGYVEMVADPCTLFELTKFGQTYGYIETPNEDNGLDYFNGMTNNATTFDSSTNTFMYRMKSNDVNVYQADDFVHAILDDNYTRYPETVSLFLTEEDYTAGTSANTYTVRRGKSLLYDAYKIWREKQLLEASALLNRITRSSVTRQIGVEVGDMPKEQTQQTLRRVKELFEQKSAYNTGKSMAEYNNPGPIENNVYFATHNGQGAITVQNVGGDFDPKQLTDLDWWNNKFYSSFGIPKQYFGWTDDGAGFNGGTSLTILSSVYAKGVKRVQNALIQAITDIVNLILIQRGCVSYLNNFTIKMKAPTTQEENDYRAAFTNRINAISSMNSLFSDVEDKARRISILKTLVSTLNYGDDLLAILDDEIEAQEEKARKAEEEAEAQAALDAAAGGEGAGGDLDLDLDLGSDNNAGGEDSGADMDLNTDLSNIPEAQESFLTNGGATLLTEEQEVVVESDEDNLPSPDDLPGDVDFTQNI